MFNILAYLVHIGALTVYVNTGGLPRDFNATTNQTHTKDMRQFAENIMVNKYDTSLYLETIQSDIEYTLPIELIV